MQSVSVTEGVNQSSHDHFGTRVPTLGGPHCPAANLTQVCHLAEGGLETRIAFVPFKDLVVTRNERVKGGTTIRDSGMTPRVEIERDELGGGPHFLGRAVARVFVAGRGERVVFLLPGRGRMPVRAAAGKALRATSRHGPAVPRCGDRRFHDRRLCVVHRGACAAVKR